MTKCSKNKVIRYNKVMSQRLNCLNSAIEFYLKGSFKKEQKDMTIIKLYRKLSNAKQA